MALMHLTIVPLGTGSTSLGDFVADIQETLRKEQFTFQLTDMGTIIEGETAQLLSLAARLHELPFLRGAQRVSTHLTLDDRRDKKVSIGDKTASITQRFTD
ncbi:MTH1187 family thiamine-binding protein [Thermodesulfobacteriota bacterium]